ncbi:enoyl-CoA hydratase/isomerase family protein [Sphingopyxis sp. 550A]
MEYRHIKIERADAVLTCRMSNPPDQVLNRRMLGELHHLLGHVESEADLRVFILTGENDMFLRWMDLNEMQRMAEGQQEEVAASRAAELFEVQRQIPQVITSIHQLGLRIQNLSAVTVAAINGVVGGGGCELSLAFDFRLMMDHPDATFALPQTSFGLVPGSGGVWHSLHLLGRAKALDLLLHGEFIPPAQALELGLISRLYPAETYQDDVAAFVANIAARAPLALKGVKALVRAWSSQGQLDFYAKENAELAKVIHSEDVKHALGLWLSNPDPAAYFPEFHGR